MERVSGKKLESNVLPASHKVQIMEYLLSCSVRELNKYKDIDHPTFIYECAALLIDDRMEEYLNVLTRCRAMAREDANITK